MVIIRKDDRILLVMPHMGGLRRTSSQIPFAFKKAPKALSVFPM